MATPVAELARGSWPGRKVAWDRGSFRRGELAARVETSLARESGVARSLRPYYDEALYVALGAATPKVVVGRDKWLFLAGTVRGFDSARDRARLEDVSELVASLDRWLAARGTTMLVAPVPSKAAVYGGKLPHPPPAARTLDAMTRHGISALDLGPALDPGAGDTYLSNDEHWSPLGARRACEAIAAWLRARTGGALPGAAVSGTIATGPPALHRGDLLGMLGFRKGGRLEARFLVPVRDVLGAGPSGSELRFEAPEAIVVAGTSFSFVGHVGSLLSVMLERMVEERTTAGLGPAASTVTLVEDIRAGKRPAPAILVWEIPERHIYDERLAPRLRALLAGRRESTAGEEEARE